MESTNKIGFKLVACVGDKLISPLFAPEDTATVSYISHEWVLPNIGQGPLTVFSGVTFLNSVIAAARAVNWDAKLQLWKCKYVPSKSNTIWTYTRYCFEEAGKVVIRESRVEQVTLMPETELADAVKLLELLEEY